MLHYFGVQWIRDNEPPLFAIVVDCDEANDFSEFCEEIYKTVPESDRLKASTIICRLPISRSFRGRLIGQLSTRGVAARIPKDELLLLSIREAISSEDSYLNRRFGHMEVRLLYSDDYTIGLSDNISRVKAPFVSIASSQMGAFITYIRQTELRGLVEGSPALFPFLGGVPYLTPSGDPARVFVRIGNVQGRRSAVHAIFFWMLPHLRRTSAILVDTWSISSIAYNASRLLSRYRGPKSPIARVDMLSEYHSNSETSLKLNLEVLRRFLAADDVSDETGEVTFVVSAVRTGKLLGQIKNTMVNLGYGLPYIKFLVLYALQPPITDDYLCDLSHIRFEIDEQNSLAVATTSSAAPLGPRGTSGESATYSSGGARANGHEGTQDKRQGSKEESTTDSSPPIRELPRQSDPSSRGRRDGGGPPKTEHIVIDPMTYFPKLRNEVSIEIRNDRVKADRQVYSGYAGQNVFLVHRTQVDDRAPRHHAIYVETANLIKCARFRQRLDDYIQNLQRAPDLVVAPDHVRARRLAELIIVEIGKRFNANITSLIHPNLHVNPLNRQPQDEEVGRAFASLGPNSEILIVDDAFVTGTRLYQYSQHLRYIGDGGYRGRVDFLVAIARPPDIAKWDEAKRLLSYRPPHPSGQKVPANTVNAIETIVLPNWDTTNCPWCIEKGKLEDYQALVEHTPRYFTNRLHVLGVQGIQGMADQLFLEHRDQLPIQLRSGSLFTADQSNQAAGFAAVAGGIQRLRTDESDVKLGSYRYPLSTILESDEYLEKVYNDSLLRASFLRAAHREELSYLDIGRETERANYACNLILDPSGEINNLTLELCWQVLQAKLPGQLFKVIPGERFAELGVEDEVKYLRSIYSKLPITPRE